MPNSSYFNKRISVAPSEPYGHNQKGSLYLIQGKNQEAIAEFEKGLAKEEQVYGYRLMGYVWEREGAIEKARDIYRRGIKNLPEESQELVYQLGLLERLSRYHLLEFYLWARRIETRVERYFFSRGWTSWIDMAIKTLERIHKSSSVIEGAVVASLGVFILLGIAALAVRGPLRLLFMIIALSILSVLFGASMLTDYPLYHPYLLSKIDKMGPL